MLAGSVVRFSTVRIVPGVKCTESSRSSDASSPSLAITRAPGEHDVHRLRDLGRELRRRTREVVRQDDGELARRERVPALEADGADSGVTDRAEGLGVGEPGDAHGHGVRTSSGWW